MFAFWWNFFMWLPNMVPWPGIFLLGIVDSVIVLMLLITTVLQSKYIGHSRRQCAQLSPDRSEKSSLLFFERIAMINSTNPTYAKDLCNEYASAFDYGIALLLAAYCY